MSFTAKNGRFHKGNASRLGKLGVAARAKKRMENPPDQEPRRVPAGDLIGVLQGQRMNGIRVAAKGKTTECGWDHLFRTLRKKLSMPKRIFNHA